MSVRGLFHRGHQMATLVLRWLASLQPRHSSLLAPPVAQPAPVCSVWRIGFIWSKQFLNCSIITSAQHSVLYTTITVECVQKRFKKMTTFIQTFFDWQLSCLKPIQVQLSKFRNFSDRISWTDCGEVVHNNFAINCWQCLPVPPGRGHSPAAAYSRAPARRKHE